MGLEFNVVKCHSTECVGTLVVFFDSMHDIPLVPSGNSVMGFNILFDRELNFHSHIKNSYSKVLTILELFRRVCSKFKLITPLQLLYCTFFRLVLKYGAIIWDPLRVI